MLKKLKEVLENYSKEYNGAHKEYLKRKEFIDKNYLYGSPEYKRVMADATALLDVKLAPLKSDTYMKSKEILSTSTEKLKTKITEGITQEMIMELDLLRKVNLSEDDINAFLNKYKNSYLGCKALKEIAEEKNLKVEIVTLKDSIDEINDLAEMTNDFIENYSGQGKLYKHELLLSDNFIDNIAENAMEFASYYES